ncbi:serine/threonine-protein kinase [Streptomyces sp. CC77]|uniref:serine/threonine-protein kinase n=1 Tax=Streptomyces sp. CC77 TaxID=1906739 RepID=UPI0009A0B9AD|nr:serine/threonine-protein kinase [Streptomyces sp. CC77]
MPPLRGTGPIPEAEPPERQEYAGRYRLGEVLGSGGMGVVRLAVSGSGLRLAVKVVHREHAADPEFRARFRQEVSAARRVSGAFTAPVVDADPDADRPWMATLFIEGPTLSERVKRNGPLAAAELRRVGAGLAEALRDIHRVGVVHRDLKPSNVLLASDGPRVIDFGISRPADSDVRTETGKLIGSPPFMAPEQFQRPREVGPAADVFAMGAVLVHAATGRGPFDSNSPYIVAYQVVHNEPDLAGVPDELAPVLLRCLAKDPEERPTPEELMTALRLPEEHGRVPAQRRRPAQALGADVGAGTGAAAAAGHAVAEGAAGEAAVCEAGEAGRAAGGAVGCAGQAAGGVAGVRETGAAHPSPDASGAAEHLGPTGGAAGAVPAAAAAGGAAGVVGTPPGASGGASVTDAAAAAGAGPAPRTARGRRRLPRALVGVAAALAVGAAGVVVAVQGCDASGARPAGPAGATVRAFTPWTVRLGAEDGTAAGSGADRGHGADGGSGQEVTGGTGGAASQPPVCAAHGTDLYCTAPGIKAARLRQVGGDRVWSVPGSGAEGSGGGAELFVSGDGVYVVNPGTAAREHARLEALALGDGSLRWGHDLASYARVVPVRGGVLVVLADGRVRVLDAGTGTWCSPWPRRPTELRRWSPPWTRLTGRCAGGSG